MQLWTLLSGQRQYSKQVVKVIWQETASLLQTGGSTVFARGHQCALPCGHIDTSWRIRLNLCFLWPTQVHNPKRQIDQFSCCYTAHGMYFTMGAFPQKIAPSHGACGPLSNTWFPGPTWVLNPNGIWISAAIFAGPTSVTDRPIDHATRLATTDHIYVHSTGDAVSKLEVS